MGTNYYALYNKCKSCERYDSLHLGKSSFGWKFLFRKHPFEISCFREFIDFINSDDVDIIDEYGKLINKEDFINMIEEKQKNTKILNERKGSDIEIIDGYEFKDGDFS